MFFMVILFVGIVGGLLLGYILYIFYDVVGLVGWKWLFLIEVLLLLLLGVVILFYFDNGIV